MAYSETKITEIIQAFEKWFPNDNHSKIEDFYSGTLTLENISSLTQTEFEDYFLEFAKQGGKIQSGGARNANKFIKNVHNNFAEFKQKVLEPFNPNFDLYKWLRWSESFKFFGKGTATIYLNRVNKRRFVIVNNKSIEAYKKLGYKISSTPLESTYKGIFDAQSNLIKKHPELNNYFKADALSHFLIATPEGLAISTLEEINNPIIKNISKDDVENAIGIIRTNPSLRKGRESIEYDLIHDKNRYPPILVLSEANKLVGGQELLLSDFGNSTKNAFSILQTLGFIIERKTMNFSEQLAKFLAQSENGELTTSGYVKHYEDLEVRVSFGQGNQARITWIAFLAYGHTVSNGIYPVYLYFKKNKLLILAYGASESKKPEANWSLPNLKSINEYFKENQFERPERYGTSYVFKIYNTLEPIIPDEANKDLNDLIELYKQEIDREPKPPKPEPVKFNYRSFQDSTDTANLLLDKALVLRFISALLTKPFIILTGLSGSGKTKLAQAFSKWICETDDQICLVPVGADWTNREPLLGFPSALEKGRYILPENGVLSLILNASRIENQDKPYFLILDEMNLSHVERYFADFLSAMESGDQIPLHSNFDDLMNNGAVPASITIPKNLFIIGTVNIDETTYMFSPKVLDRASVIEFRVSQLEMNKFLTTTGNLNLNNIKGLGSSMAGDFLDLSQSKELGLTNKEIVSHSLLKFFFELKKVGAEFGYRSASEIMRFSSIINIIDDSWETSAIIDASIMQKLLPKVHGSRRKLEPVLKTLALLCLSEDFKNGNGFKIEALLNSEEDIEDKENISYPVSFEKIRRMYRRLIDNGFTSYAEA